MRTKTKKAKEEKFDEVPEMPKPTIPSEILERFLEDKIKLREMTNVKEVKCNFLWEKNKIQRYRINIWQEEHTDGQYCSRFYIGHSWFIHYCTRTKEITDKTIQPKLEV